ncbi:elafin [Nycticebus coucang]|uniref:elafin n=1 Tax=Nycticebus coucang TaxID=9470 RepID=UPI00234CA425|nr:elafin [Nycticebus coucang]
MKTSSFLVLVVLFVLGTLAVEAAVKGVPAKGQGTGKGRVPLKRQDPLKGQVSGEADELVKGKGPVRGPGSTKPGSCPEILIRCAMLNPPNRCWSDTQCPGTKKCCEGSCGKICLIPQ